MAWSPRYSANWFNTFAAAIPASTTSVDVDGIVRCAPPSQYRRLLDIGCGIGRTTRECSARGYEVTGIDESVQALIIARDRTPAGRFIALDFRDVGQMRWTFDVVTILWNSLGFGSVDDDRAVLRAVGRILRPGGRLLLDLYHPDWLSAHQQSGATDDRGVTVDRWVLDGRCHHRFRYADGSCDRIQFNVYRPDDVAELLRQADLREESRLVWWRSDVGPSATHARYQIVASRRAEP